VRFVVLPLCFGLAAGLVGKMKGGSFLLWFVIGFCLPVVGLAAALLYRRAESEPHRRCPRCGSVRPLSDQVCMTCGEDMEWTPRQVKLSRR
jgi:DNA-directed RNA polymerase subunit RPC12/RpoP